MWPGVVCAVASALVQLMMCRAAVIVRCDRELQLLVCPGTVGDMRHLRFAVDTGTARTLLDRSAAEGLRIRRTVAPVVALGHVVQAERVDLPMVRLGSRTYGGVRASVCSLGRATRGGLRLDGVAGMDVIGRSSILIDYKRSRITLGRVGALLYRVPLVSSARGFAVIDAELDGKRVRLVVDTGAEGLTIFGLESAHSGDEPIDATGLDGAVRVSRVGRRTLLLGDVRQAVDVTTLIAPGSARDDYGADGLLGPLTLGASLVSLDFERHEFSWAP